MGFAMPSFVEDYLSLGEAAYFLAHNNPSIVVTLFLGVVVAAVLSVWCPDLAQAES